MPLPDRPSAAELLLKLGVPDTQTAYEQAHRLGFRVWELAGDREGGDPSSVLERALALLADDADDVFRREQWAAALRWEADQAREAADRYEAQGNLRAADAAKHNASVCEIDAHRIESGALTPWADTPEPATPPAQPAHDAPAGDGGHPGTPDGPAVLGRALLAGARVWLEDAALTGGWTRGNGVWLTREQIEEHAPVREVLLVRPEVGRVLEAVTEWRAGHGPQRHCQHCNMVLTWAQADAVCPNCGYDAAVLVDLAAAVDALEGDRPVSGGPDHDGLTGAPTANLATASRGLAAPPIPPLDLTDAERDAFGAAMEHGKVRAVDYDAVAYAAGGGFRSNDVDPEPAPEQAGEHPEALVQLLREMRDQHLDGYADQVERLVQAAIDAGVDSLASELETVDQLRAELGAERARRVPEPAGDGPGWDRDTINKIAAHMLTPELRAQVLALVADRDVQASDAVAQQRRADRAERELTAQASGFLDATNRLTVEREEVRAQLADVVGANHDWATGVTATRLQAELDRWKARAERAEARVDGQAWAALLADRDRWREAAEHKDRVYDMLAASQDAAHDDLAAILRELGLGDQARSASPQQVVRDEVLPAIRRLRGKVDEMQQRWKRAMDDGDDQTVTRLRLHRELREARAEVDQTRLQAAGGRWRPDRPLTEAEQDAIRMAGELWNQLCRAVGDGPTRAADLQELCGHIHAIQHAVMANAAARAYPDTYRLLGGTIRPASEVPTSGQPEEGKHA